MEDRPQNGTWDTAHRGALLPDGYLLEKDDSEMVSFVLGGQNFSYSVAPDGRLTWGAFGRSFHTLGELRTLAVANPPPSVGAIEESETVGLELFGNMLDTIAFLRVRLRALADVVIEKGIVSGPELLGKYAEYHEKSFEAFHDLMLLKPEIFDQRFAGWISTEKEYREQLAADRAASVEP